MKIILEEYKRWKENRDTYISRGATRERAILAFPKWYSEVTGPWAEVDNPVFQGDTKEEVRNKALEWIKSLHLEVTILLNKELP